MRAEVPHFAGGEQTYARAYRIVFSNRKEVAMNKIFSTLGIGLSLGMLLVTAPHATALTITQISNQNVGNPPFPATACVDVQNASTASATPVGPFPCNNQFNEQWIYENGRFIGIGTHNATITSTTLVETCLSVHGNSTTSGAGVELDTCISGNASQLWDVRGNGTTSVIINVASGLCLDSRGQIGGGLQLIINVCNVNAAGQHWLLK
jgi:Ricin-type beta-trefoil lectin domain